jgi:hypothetical protein
MGIRERIRQAGGANNHICPRMCKTCVAEPILTAGAVVTTVGVVHGVLGFL